MSILRRQDLIVEGLASIHKQAKYFTINFGGRLTSNYDKDQIFIELPYTTNYEILIHDPNFFTLNFIPVAIPKVYRGTLVNETKNYAYSMLMTEVQELDLPQDPCNMDKKYNFQVIPVCGVIETEHVFRPVLARVSHGNCLASSNGRNKKVIKICLPAQLWTSSGAKIRFLI